MRILFNLFSIILKVKLRKQIFFIIHETTESDWYSINSCSFFFFFFNKSIFFVQQMRECKWKNGGYVFI